MRTKTLLLTAALSAAGIASSLGQVYSVNSVGYVNKDLPAGFSIIANPLNNGNNALSEILPSVPEGATVYRFNPASQSYLDASTFFFGAWTINYQIPPGEGFFIQLASPQTVTFVGEVPQGAASNVPLSPNFSIMASAVPQTGLLSSDLEYPASEGDTVFIFDSAAQNYEDSRTFFFGTWSPSEPSVEVAQGFFLQRTSGGNWNRNFSVN